MSIMSICKTACCEQVARPNLEEHLLQDVPRLWSFQSCQFQKCDLLPRRLVKIDTFEGIMDATGLRRWDISKHPSNVAPPSTWRNTEPLLSTHPQRMRPVVLFLVVGLELKVRWMYQLCSLSTWCAVLLPYPKKKNQRNWPGSQTNMHIQEMYQYVETAETYGGGSTPASHSLPFQIANREKHDRFESEVLFKGNVPKIFKREATLRSSTSEYWDVLRVEDCAI